MMSGLESILKNLGLDPQGRAVDYVPGDKVKLNARRPDNTKVPTGQTGMVVSVTGEGVCVLFDGGYGVHLTNFMFLSRST